MHHAYRVRHTHSCRWNRRISSITESYMSESPGAQQVRSSLLVGVLAFTGIVGALTQTLVVPLIAQLPAILNTSSSNASWVITVTLLTGAVATPVVGRLGDMYGKRRMLLICTVPLVLGSVLCAMASSLVPMLI